MNLFSSRQWKVMIQRWKLKMARRKSKKTKSKAGAFATTASVRFKRLRDWFSSARKKRSVRNLLFGLPAVVIGLASFGIGMFATFASADAEGKYRQLAGISYLEKDYDSALLYLERLRQSGDSADDSTYMLAATLGQLGEVERASAMLDKLAPEDTAGYPKAHLIKARQILTATRFTDDEHRNRAFFHITTARNGLVETDDEIAEAYFLSARCHFMAGDNTQGLRFLREATRREASYLYDLASVCNTLGRADEFKSAVQNAHSHYRRILAQDETDAGSRMALGKTLGLMRQYEQAQAILIRGKALHPKAEFGQQIAILCLVEYDQLLQREDTQPLRRIQLLQIALDNDSNSMPAMKRLLKFGEEQGSTPELRAEVDDFLETIISSGEATAVVHLAYGTKAWESGRRDIARVHLTRAYELDQGIAAVANNLAWTLAFQKPIDLEGALELIDSVISMHSAIDASNAPYWDTRGQILGKMGRWNQCQKDLLAALPYMSESPLLHRTLAESYNKSTPPQPRLAEKHKKIASDLER